MTARDESPVRRLAAGIGLALLLAGLLNGIGPWLRRTGLIETGLYERFWALHTAPSGFTRAPFGLGRRCVLHRPSDDGLAIASGGSSARYVFAVRRWELPLKALKDLLLVGLAAASLWAWARGRGHLVPLNASWPVLLLAVVVAAHAAAGLLRGAPLITLAGLRGFAFLGVALAAGWVTGDLFRRLVPWLLGLLALQLFLAPLEFLRGIPVQGHLRLFGEGFARRAMGTFVMPNSLGVFAACVVALAAGFGVTARQRALAWILGLLVVLASGSATGLVLLGAIGAWQALAGPRRPGKLELSALGAALVAGAILLVHGRSDVLSSLLGRLSSLRALLDAPPASVLFGRQLGFGTNAAGQLLGGLENHLRVTGPALAGGESAIGVLVLQTGLAGLALFAVALALAWARVPPARPLVLALAAACFTLSVPEVFPLNLLLGLALACGPENKAWKSWTR